MKAFIKDPMAHRALIAEAFSDNTGLTERVHSAMRMLKTPLVT